MKFHCIVHQDNTCTKALNIVGNIVQIIIKYMGFIRAKGLLSLQFQECLESIHAEGLEIWLSS